MCGISCVVHVHERSCNHGFEGLPSGQLGSELTASLESIKHRGPDAHGIWISDDRRVALGHCRLAINDLSPSASQPLHSPNHRIHAVINGEIYDFDRLRQDLASHYNFNTRSDSEVVVALYQRYGTPGFLEHLRGEFALCIYDERTRQFIAARDRYGIKPLFWTMSKGRLLVAAEVKAFLDLGWNAEWDVRSLVEGGWNFDDRTLFRDVKKVKPGQYLICELDNGVIQTKSYWDIEYSDKRIVEARTEDEMILGLREHMLEAVRLRLRADVPIGIYLSGGIDSSALAGMAAHLVKEQGLTMGTDEASHRICCFTISFDKTSGYDESDVSERTVDWLGGVKYVKKMMNEEQLAFHFEDATWHCEQHNHGDLNYVGKFALSDVARKNGYKVVLTGEGADEIFAGYPIYLPDFLRERDHAWPSADMGDHERKRLCAAADADIGKYYASIGADGSNRGADQASQMLGGISTPASMCAFHFDDFVPWTRELHAKSPRMSIAKGVNNKARDQMRTSWHPLHSALYTWTKGHLVNGFLSCLGDRTEMAHSIEARPPFLDHRLTEYVNSLPPSLKIKHDAASGEFVEKWIQREAARPFIPHELYVRKKHPYSAPTYYPANGPMHRLFQRLCTEQNVRQLGFVEWEGVKNLVEMAFDKGQAAAMRKCFVLGQWVVLAERFGIKTATLHQDA